MRDLNAIESIFRRIQREVWIVTAADGDRRGGLLATWVSPASIDRESPTVLAGIAPNHFTAELIEASGSFAAHLITANQLPLAWNFALGSGRDRDKLAGLNSSTAETGAPILTNCLAWLDCRVFFRQDTGDRTYFWADVLAAGTPGAGVPLTDQALFAAASEQQLRQLIANRDADIQLQRPLNAEWRNSLAIPW